MHYKLGDFVRFVEEQGEGHVTAIINDEMIAVTGEDGFEIPVLASKVTPVYGRMDRDDDVEVPLPEKKGPFVGEGIYLAITGDQRQGLVEFYILNESSYQVLFSLNTEKAQQVKGEKSGMIQPDSSEKVYTANASTIGNWPVFNFQFLFHTSSLKDVKKPLSMSKKIRPADLSAAKKELALLGKKAWTFRLDEPETNLDTDKLKAHFFSHRPKKS